MDHRISPGSLLSAKDQFDNGPVMLRTVTQISSNELQQSGKGTSIKLKFSIGMRTYEAKDG